MYLKVAQNGFWHSILKTMLLGEALLDECQLCIIRKHIHHISWNTYDNSNTSHNFCPLFQGSGLFFLGHIVKAFQNNFAFIISTETCFWLKRVSDRTLAVFSSLETRFNTHLSNRDSKRISKRLSRVVAFIIDLSVSRVRGMPGMLSLLSSIAQLRGLQFCFNLNFNSMIAFYINHQYNILTKTVLLCKCISL